MWINLSKRPLTSRERKLILIFIICFYSAVCIFIYLTYKIIKLNDLREQLQAITNESSVYKQLYETQ